MLSDKDATDEIVPVLELSLPISCVRPSSIYECWDLLNFALGRDSLLVKGLENRNTVTVDDVITGISTEDIREARLRQSLALAYLPRFLKDLNCRNVKRLGSGFVNVLLSLETETDEDGIPNEAEELKMTNLIGNVIVESALKSNDPNWVRQLVDSIVPNDEVMFYTKYKFLKSVRCSVSALEYRLQYAPTVQQVALRSQNNLVLARKCRTYLEHANRSIDAIFFSTINTSTPNPFTHDLLLAELIATKLSFFKQSRNDVDMLIPFISDISKQLCFSSRKNTPSNHLVSAFMSLLLASPHVLVELVEDESARFHLRKALTGLVKTGKYEAVIIETATSILSCLV